MTSYPNSRIVEWGLLLFSFFIVLVTIFNIVEYSNILQGPENPNFSFDSARTWLIINSILLVIALIYFCYRVYHWLFAPNLRKAYTAKIKNYLAEQPYPGVIGAKNTTDNAPILIDKPILYSESAKTNLGGITAENLEILNI